MTDLAVDPDPRSIEGRAFRLGRQAALELPEKPAAFTAAARTINLESPRDKARVGKRGSTVWQQDAWTYYDVLPEVKRGATFKGRSLGKLVYYPAWRPTPDSPPIALSDLDGIDGAPSPQLVELVQRATNRLDGGQGTLATMAARWGSNGFVAGEGFIVTWDDPTAASGAQARFCSIDELQLTTRDTWAIREDPESPEADWLDLPHTALIVRVWNQHARYSAVPDSSVRGVLEPCEQLALLQALGIGVTMSRMNAGMLAIPDTMLSRRRRPARQAEAGDDAQHVDPIITALMAQVTTPIADPRSAAAAAPFVVSGSREDIEAIRHITFGRESDGDATAKIAAAVTRIANGVDLPAEVLLGMGDLNHWTAWLVSDETYRAYVEPDAREFGNAVATGYLVPMLMAAGENFEDAAKFCYAHNADALVADPDETERVFKAHEQVLISGEAARKRLRFTEDEAPTTEDIALAEAMRGRRPTGPTDGGEQPPAQDQPTDDAVTAAAPADPRIQAAMDRWVDRDRALRTRLVTMADAAMHRALDRAGAQLRTRASKSRVYRDAIDGAPNRQLAARLGPAVVRTVLAAEDDTDLEALLLAGAWDDLAARFRSMTARAQAATLDELQDLGLPPAAAAQLENTNTENRDRAGTWLVAALGALAVTRLFDPNPTADPGEGDPTTTVPAGIARTALSVAGGAAGTPGDGGGLVNPVTDAPAGGAAAGETTMGALGTMGLVPWGYRWSYGDPSSRGSSFEPHHALDLVAFTTWTDPLLLNTAPWPRVGYFYPGDHRGCECDAYPILRPPPAEG